MLKYMFFDFLIEMDEASLPKQIGRECFALKSTNQKTERINLEFFSDLEKAGKKNVIDFCIKMGFIASTYECPECTKPMKLSCHKDRGHDGFVWLCKHKSINKRSIRSGSWFQESRLSLTMMLKLAYLWVKKTPSLWIDDELNLSKNTVCYWMSFFRRICLSAIETEGVLIGGPEETVEIDAKSFAVSKSKRGHDTWVFGGVERIGKKCFLEIIHSGEEGEILRILQKYVRPGTKIISDNWKGFDCLKINGYVHQKVGKITGFRDQTTGMYKNNITNLWSIIKKIPNKRTGNDQFNSHLAEIMWRRSHQEETQALLRLYFKLLCRFFPPRVRDDPSYISKKVESEEKGNCIETQSKVIYIDDFQEEIPSDDENTDESEEETQSKFIYIDDFKEEIPSDDANTDESEQDELETENGSQKKRQKTVESSDI